MNIYYRCSSNNEHILQVFLKRWTYTTGVPQTMNICYRCSSNDEHILPCSICSSQYKQNLHQKFMYLYMICFVLFLWYFPPLVFIYIYMLAWVNVSILSLFLCFVNWTLKSFSVCGIFCFSLSFIIVYCFILQREVCRVQG
jgi:hypothetical protein